MWNFLRKINFIDNKNSLTPKGNYLLSKSYAYGVTDSYMKTFVHIEDLCLNKTRGLTQKTDKNNNEYQLVEANEANPLVGKISSVSPVGAAILGRREGDEVTVSTPAGEQVYTIDAIK